MTQTTKNHTITILMAVLVLWLAAIGIIGTDIYSDQVHQNNLKIQSENAQQQVKYQELLTSLLIKIQNSPHLQILDQTTFIAYGCNYTLQYEGRIQGSYQYSKLDHKFEKDYSFKFCPPNIEVLQDEYQSENIWIGDQRYTRKLATQKYTEATSSATLAATYRPDIYLLKYLTNAQQLRIDLNNSSPDGLSIVADAVGDKGSNHYTFTISPDHQYIKQFEYKLTDQKGFTTTGIIVFQYTPTSIEVPSEVTKMNGYPGDDVEINQENYTPEQLDVLTAPLQEL